ncbi:MAG: NrfD/PsrC family molybdoenzyme membrane anchor subunit [Dehalococcoidales bacterium]
MTKYTQQKNWIDGRGNFIAFAFFLGGISGGLFMAAAYFDSLLGMFIAWLLSLCMGISYMIHLGQPLQSWRMFMRPRTSWISRGFIFIMLFIGLTFITLILRKWFPDASGAITTFKVLAGIFAFAQSIYTGFAVSYVSAIKLWNSAILPILFVVCGFSGGIAILLGISLNGDQVTVIENVARITLIAFAVILIVYLWNATYSSATAKNAVARLMRGGIGIVFWIGVVVLGVIIPIAVSVGTYFAGEASSAWLLTAVVTEVIGGLSLRYVILKGGMYLPLTSGE